MTDDDALTAAIDAGTDALDADEGTCDCRDCPEIAVRAAWPLAVAHGIDLAETDPAYSDRLDRAFADGERAGREAAARALHILEGSMIWNLLTTPSGPRVGR